MGIKASVYMERLFNKKGFTFVSTITSITILFITLPLLVYLLEITVSTVPENDDEFSVRQFYYFFRDELIAAKSYTVHSDRVLLYSHDDEVVMEQYKDTIRRRVNDEGHEVYMRNVKDVSFSEITEGIRVQLVLQDGEYEKDIYFYE